MKISKWVCLLLETQQMLVFLLVSLSGHQQRVPSKHDTPKSGSHPSEDRVAAGLFLPPTLTPRGLVDPLPNAPQVEAAHQTTTHTNLCLVSCVYYVAPVSNRVGDRTRNCQRGSAWQPYEGLCRGALHLRPLSERCEQLEKLSHRLWQYRPQRYW